MWGFASSRTCTCVTGAPRSSASATSLLSTNRRCCSGILSALRQKCWWRLRRRRLLVCAAGARLHTHATHVCKRVRSCSAVRACRSTCHSGSFASWIGAAHGRFSQALAAEDMPVRQCIALSTCNSPLPDMHAWKKEMWALAGQHLSSRVSCSNRNRRCGSAVGAAICIVCRPTRPATAARSLSANLPVPAAAASADPPADPPAVPCVPPPLPSCPLCSDSVSGSPGRSGLSPSDAARGRRGRA